MMEKTSFDSWAIVELMGHSRIAGRVSEAEVGGGKLLRVDVPEVAGLQAITKYFGTVAVYALTPVDEETARLAAAEIGTSPVNLWSAREWLKRTDEAKALPAPTWPKRDQADEDAEDEEPEDNRPF